MTNKKNVIGFIAAWGLLLSSCEEGSKYSFDNMDKTISVGNWIYNLKVEQAQESESAAGTGSNRYLRATLSLGNSKTNQSLLYSASKDHKQYEKNYTYLSFNSKKNLYLKCKNDTTFPIGYVFEPSNGLNTKERLVYKFMITNEQYNKLKENSEAIEYWYVDQVLGLGKICFNASN